MPQTDISAAQIIISISLMLMGGFAMTRVTKLLHLPNVTAYILTGILMGPACFDLIPQPIIDGTEFVSDISLAFIAFGVGEFFRVSALKRSGGSAIVVTLIEAVIVSVVMFCVMFFLLGIDFALAIVLAALAAATAPTSTMMTIRQTKARGPFVDTLLQVMALDNVLSLVAYSVAISLALAATSSGGFDVGTVLLPIAKNIAATLIGAVFGLLLHVLMKKKHTTDNRLIIAVGILFAFCGVCALLDVSPLLGCMMIGTVYINISDDNSLFLQLAYFAPPLLLLFFVRSGCNFNFGALAQGGSFGGSPLWLISAVYFVVRMLTKYGGAFIGSAIMRRPKEVRNYMGLALIPQAGVAIGLSALGARALGGELGATLETVILASSILYELVGPPLAKLSLSLSGAIGAKEVVEPAPDAQALIEQVKRIREENAKDPSLKANSAMLPLGAEERAFTEAAEEQMDAQFESMNNQRPGLHRGGLNRR